MRGIFGVGGLVLRGLGLPAVLGNAAARHKLCELAADTAASRTDLDAPFAGLATDVR
jgi:hypothetical protein